MSAKALSVWPQHCVHDPGTEFTGPELQMLLQNCHVRDVCTTAKNPQSNSVCERMHQTVGNVLRTLLHGNPLQNIANAAQHVDEALSIAMHTIQAGVHSRYSASQCGAQSNAVNLIFRLFLYHFLHTMSS